MDREALLTAIARAVKSDDRFQCEGYLNAIEVCVGNLRLWFDLSNITASGEPNTAATYFIPKRDEPNYEAAQVGISAVIKDNS